MSRVRPGTLFRVFTWTGLTSLGGGRSAYLYEALVLGRRWVKNDEFVQDLTLSQLLPGPNFTNLAVALGMRLGGWWGAAWGALALILPGSVILLALGAVYLGGGFGPGAARAMLGMSAAVIGLVFVTTARMFHGSVKNLRTLALAALVFALEGPHGLHTALAIALAAPVSFWLARRARAAS